MCGAPQHKADVCDRLTRENAALVAERDSLQAQLHQITVEIDHLRSKQAVPELALPSECMNCKSLQGDLTAVTQHEKALRRQLRDAETALSREQGVVTRLTAELNEAKRDVKRERDARHAADAGEWF